jgi:hypothetical protein
MQNISFNFSETVGKIKPMHSTNNGPVYKFAADQRVTNLESYREAGIPYARNHDAAFNATYGGEHIVDVNFIFRNFDADPYSPDSYDFTLTDEYLKVIEFAGAKVFYRFGSKIEHWPKKYNTLPPKDFKKWAVICEHIIKHYCYGWANGFNMDIEYWEIWNEPDLDADDSPNKRCWGGTAKEFYELYRITLDHLKTAFPNLKIGGPAIAHVGDGKWMRGLLDSLGDIKPDFFSWHVYGATTDKVKNQIRLVRSILDEYGLTECESILNEWNYVKGWEGDIWKYSLGVMKNYKGAAFLAATMLMAQDEALDNLMYYDARPGGMNGMFTTDDVTVLRPGYYAFYTFNKLYRAGEEVKSKNECEDGTLYGVAARGDGIGKAMLTYYSDNDTLSEKKEVKVSFENAAHGGKLKATVYMHCEGNDYRPMREEIFTQGNFSIYLQMPKNSIFFIDLEEA